MNYACYIKNLLYKFLNLINVLLSEIYKLDLLLTIYMYENDTCYEDCIRKKKLLNSDFKLIV